MEHKRSQWASNIGFILAAAGSAVGLGNIWKFPGKVAAGGGGAFLICYALIVLLVGFPVMLAATLLLVIPMSFLSAGYSLSQGAMDIKLPWFDFTNGVQYLPMNAVMEKFTDNLMIPLGALCFCLFVGWVWGTENASKEIEASGHSMASKRLWAFLVKFLAPVVIVVILYFTVGRGQGLS